ncbi:hypothetical protein [Bradyrhizobium sp.]|uniref:hypothetical protein n=1 Tax=Bradyrhizobium sp. TaxID=376 RepID=UPI002716102C|nr:hypothetical protein [Bradyrhizobium sp.]MDO9294353.1 hypothetical protein [Bradyrhizobium sp.]
MTASVLPELLDTLRAYLARQVQAWLDQPEGARLPTLPVLSDDKVNVLAIAEESGIGAARQQHLFKRPELKSLVNAVAFEQGLKPIGGRMPSEELEREAVAHVRRTEARSNDLSKLVAEQASVIERQRREIEGLREQLRMFEETGQVLRTAVVRP